jgi:GWxTD domain-containing protein
MVLIAATGGRSAETQPLAAAHQKWIAEDVAYIITERERELFLSLATLEEREHFITAFWARRDPNPTTLDNERRIEHERRVRHANDFLGRESFLPGWRTDRGRYYILLGEPRTIQRFYGHNELKEAELWFFQAPEGRGLPAFFYLLFFKEDEVGDYRLYRPAIDGPVSLLRGADVSAATDNVVAVEKLEQMSSELAHASLSYDAGEPPDYLTARAAIGAEQLLARIEQSATRAINTNYIDAWEQYGHRVAAEYSFNFVPSRHVFATMMSTDVVPATAIVHYSIELDPASFGFETDEAQSRFYTTLDVTVEATNAQATLVHSLERSTPIELTPAEVARLEHSPVAYQDDFPLVPGEYTISVILRNRALKTFTIAETQLDIPPLDERAPALTDVILCYATALTAPALEPREVRTFQLGSVRLEPAGGGLFTSGDTVTAFTQAIAAPEGSRVRFELVSSDEVLDRVERNDIGAGGALTAELTTLGLAGGRYFVRVRLESADGVVLAEKATELVLSPRSSIARPALVYRRGFNTKIPGLVALVRGDQLWRAGDYGGARSAFEAAVSANNPDLPQATWKLATAYLREGDGERAIPLLTPLEESFPAQFEVVAGLGLGFYLRADYTMAIDYLERAIAIRAPDTSVLNALGDSHQRLGNTTRAIDLFERSLALDPAQDAVANRLKLLR